MIEVVHPNEFIPVTVKSLHGGEDEGGTLRLPNVDVVPAPEPAHVLREKMQAANDGRAMGHP